jgi:hypothetical protein
VDDKVVGEQIEADEPITAAKIFVTLCVSNTCTYPKYVTICDSLQIENKVKKLDSKYYWLNFSNVDYSLCEVTQDCLEQILLVDEKMV